MSAPDGRILDSISGWAECVREISPLIGGRTNRNWVVRVRDERFVLRIGSPSPRRLGICRSDELRVMLAAAEAGIAPAVRHADPERGIIVTDFIAGRHWSPNDIREGENLRRLATALRTVHSLNVQAAPFDPIAMATTFATDCSTPPEMESLSARVAAIHAIARELQHEHCLCHNDIGRGNFIDDGERLWLIDWECAGFGDPYYDLAIISHNNRLTAAEEWELLNAFDGKADNDKLEHLARMKIAHDWYHVHWYALRLSTGGQFREPEANQDLRHTRDFHYARLVVESGSFANDGIFMG